MSTGSDYAGIVALGALLVQLVVGWKQYRAALISAEAASRSAAAALTTAENTAALRSEELRRSGVVAASQVQTERLERLRADMAELFSICYMRPFPPDLDETQRVRVLLLIARLRLVIFPDTPIGEVLNADLNNVQIMLTKRRSTGASEDFWIRVSLNAMRLILSEEKRIEGQLADGEYAQRGPLQPEMQPGVNPWLHEE